MQHESVSGLATVVATRDQTHFEDDKGHQWKTSVPIPADRAARSRSSASGASV